MVSGDSTRAAWAALLAVFCAHVFSVLITTPPEVIGKERKQPILAAGLSTKVEEAVLGAQKEPAKVSTADHPKPETRRAPVRVATSKPAAEDDPFLVAYQGLGSWIDLFNRGVWRNPSWTVRKMDKRGVRTIYLQTSTYGSSSPIVYPRKVAEFIAAAHRRDMYVIGWSVPSFTQPKRDLRRAAAAVRFKTGKGERFDSFGLDIEADIIRSIWKRNNRLMDISKKLRRVAGTDFPLGAIIPDPHSLYWPNFPYKRVAAVYDVMVPMGYFTFSARGYKNVRNYTTKNIRAIRNQTGDRETPIHVIGGIADDVGVAAARGFIRAIKEHEVLGASLYDFPITSDKTWKELSAVPQAPKGGRRSAKP
jgi:hypothetical protein